MKKIKDYLEKKKNDKRFKNLGGGHVLINESQTTSNKNVDSTQQVALFLLLINNKYIF